ncbi:unnamed protein product [Closterium sp. NIES-54]
MYVQIARSDLLAKELLDIFTNRAAPYNNGVILAPSFCVLSSTVTLSAQRAAFARDSWKPWLLLRPRPRSPPPHAARSRAQPVATRSQEPHAARRHAQPAAARNPQLHAASSRACPARVPACAARCCLARCLRKHAACCCLARRLRSLSAASYCPASYLCCLLPAASVLACGLLPATSCLLPAVSVFACGLLPTASCLLPAAYCLLSTACCLLPPVYCLLPTAFACC